MPQVSLFAGALQFYPVHVTHLNNSDERLRKLITSERAVVAYQLVIIKAKHTQPNHKARGAGPRSHSKVDKQRVLHESI